MKKLALAGLVTLSTLTPFTMPLAQAASPSVVGNWNVTFFLEPTRGVGATQCIVFKLVPGTVAGVPTSGTWTSPTFPGWNGQWVQLGDKVRFFGVTSALATTEVGDVESRTNFGGGSFNHFLKTTSVTSSAGSFVAVRVAACRTATYTHLLDEKDPSKFNLAE